MGDDEVIHSQTFSPTQSGNKHNAALNWVKNTQPQYPEGMSGLQYPRLVKIPNTKLKREITLIKGRSVIKFKESKSRPSVLYKYHQKLLCDVIQQKDRENDGMIPQEVVEAMLVLDT